MTEYGYLSPAGKGYVVKLQYQKPGSSKWYYSNRTTIASGSRGKWTFAITPTTKGTYHFKVTYAGSSTKYKSSSNTLSVVVK
jgi:hypothetical protein